MQGCPAQKPCLPWLLSRLPWLLLPRSRAICPRPRSGHRLLLLCHRLPTLLAHSPGRARRTPRWRSWKTSFFRWMTNWEGACPGSRTRHMRQALQASPARPVTPARPARPTWPIRLIRPAIQRIPVSPIRRVIQRTPARPIRRVMMFFPRVVFCPARAKAADSVVAL